MHRINAILPDDALKQYLAVCEELLLSPDRRVPFQHSREWAATFPDMAGVYAIFQDDTVVYIGESGRLKKRMRDLLDSRNHQLRCYIGLEQFEQVPGFERASSGKEFPDHIKEQLNRHMAETLSIATITPPLGRREIEEYMVSIHNPRFNRKQQRA